jgi:type II secretory pathway component GspD/PulD (secretin)
MKKATILFIVFSLILFKTAYGQPEELEVRVIEIQYGNARSLQDIVEHLKGPKGKLSVDSRTNSLVVVDSPKNIERIAEVIEKLDIRQKQVEIKVVIADVTDDFLKASGIVASKVIIPENNFIAVFGLLSSDQGTSVRSQMSVRTLNNKPARIQVTADEILGHVIYWYGDDKEIVAPIALKTGDVLEVLPRVNDDGTILVELSPSQSALTDDGDFYEKSMTTQVLINDGDTIALGGLDAGRRETGRRPFFTGRARKKQRVMMFLTATTTE